MSDLTNNNNTANTSNLMFVLGRMDGKLDALTTAMSDLKSDHQSLAQTVTRDNVAMRQQVDMVEKRLGARLDMVEDDCAAVKVSFAAAKTIATVAAVIVGAIFAVIQWVLPLFQLAT